MTMDRSSTIAHLESYLVNNPRFPFCKGCSHTTVLRKLNEALVALQIPPQDAVLVTDIGCIGLADALFENVHTVHTTHGRSTAFATGMALADSVLADGRLKPIVLIGDGGAMIGLQHLVHAAMLNVDVTVLICNNFVYGMTGGQGSGLTPECFMTATTPHGNPVPPADLCAILAASNAAFVARTTALEPSFPALLQQAIGFKGFAAVEILELCTEFAVPMNELTGKKLRAVAEQNRWQIGIMRAEERPTFAERIKDLQKTPRHEAGQPVQPQRAPLAHPISIVLAGSAGERVQSAATTLCQAAAISGLHITQKNDNPVTQGSGFSTSEMWLSPSPIDFTGIEHPDFIVITSEDGLREMIGQRMFDRLTPSALVYLDDSLAPPEGVHPVHRVAFRKTFGADRAALGALVFVARKHNLLDETLLENIVSNRLKDEAKKLVAGVNSLLTSA
jgi:pyruvate/2-oxoacid:ferredoxin oxidoreductase beta subunit